MSTSKRPASRPSARTKARPAATRAKSAKAEKAISVSAAPALASKAEPPQGPSTLKVSAKTVASGPGSQVCRLSGSLVIRDARASLAELCAALDSGCTCVDVSGVDTIDTSGVQLLLAAAMEWRRREQPLTLTGYEHLVFNAAEQLGLQSLLPIAAGAKT